MQPQASVQDSVAHINIAASEISDTRSGHGNESFQYTTKVYLRNLVHNLISYTI